MLRLILFRKSRGLEKKRQLLRPSLHATWLLDPLPEGLLEHKVTMASLSKVKDCGVLLMDSKRDVLDSSKKNLKVLKENDYQRPHAHALG